MPLAIWVGRRYMNWFNPPLAAQQHVPRQLVCRKGLHHTIGAIAFPLMKVPHLGCVGRVPRWPWCDHFEHQNLIFAWSSSFCSTSMAFVSQQLEDVCHADYILKSRGELPPRGDNTLAWDENLHQNVGRKTKIPLSRQPTALLHIGQLLRNTDNGHHLLWSGA